MIHSAIATLSSAALLVETLLVENRCEISTTSLVLFVSPVVQSFMHCGSMPDRVAVRVIKMYISMGLAT